jgi:hypothetical protein
MASSCEKCFEHSGAIKNGRRVGKEAERLIYRENNMYVDR